MIDLEGFLIEKYWHSGYDQYYYCNHVYELERLDHELHWVIRNNRKFFTISPNMEAVREACEKRGMIFLGIIEDSHDVPVPRDYYGDEAIISSFPYMERDLIHD